MAPPGRDHVRHHRFITGSSRAGTLTGRSVNGAATLPAVMNRVPDLSS